MLIPTEEQVGSLTATTKRLSDAETLQVLTEFISGTNNLSVDARKEIFLTDTKVAGLLSGGLVYALMAKKLLNDTGTNPER